MWHLEIYRVLRGSFRNSPFKIKLDHQRTYPNPALYRTSWRLYGCRPWWPVAFMHGPMPGTASGLGSLDPGGNPAASHGLVTQDRLLRLLRISICSFVRGNIFSKIRPSSQGKCPMHEMHSGRHDRRSWGCGGFSLGFSLLQRAACAPHLNLVSCAPIPTCLLSLEKKPPGMGVQVLGEISG